MRNTIVHQQSLVPRVDHPHAEELRKMSEVLDELPELVGAVHEDLIRGVRNPNRGRRGLAAEQVLRILIVKQIRQFSYAQLRFELASSWAYQSFCRLDPNDAVPQETTLQRNIRRIRPETLETILQSVVRYAVEQGVEKGRRVRTDCTLEESTIHQPSDSSLLYDSVRVITRLMVKARNVVEAISFVNHTRKAKRRAKAILHARRMEKRRPLYKDLIAVTRQCIADAETAEGLLLGNLSDTPHIYRACGIASELRHFRNLATRVLDQTVRRVIQGESVPVADKIVSIFETHTDILRKDRRETYYGHKLCLTTGESGLVLDIQVLRGNPADSQLAVEAIKRLEPTLGTLPRQVSFDGGFASQANLKALKDELQIDDVAFHKKCGLSVSEMTRSDWIYRSLKRFRAGVESTMSFLKRCFGIDRCTWKGWDAFRSYTLASSLAHNLLLTARLLLR